MIGRRAFTHSAGRGENGVGTGRFGAHPPHSVACICSPTNKHFVRENGTTAARTGFHTQTLEFSSSRAEPGMEQTGTYPPHRQSTGCELYVRSRPPPPLPSVCNRSYVRTREGGYAERLRKEFVSKKETATLGADFASFLPRLTRRRLPQLILFAFAMTLRAAFPKSSTGPEWGWLEAGNDLARDSRAGALFNDSKMRFRCRGDEADGEPALPRPPGASDAVGVVHGGARQIVVEHDR